MDKVGNQNFVKETNKKLIIDLLKKTGPLARADIKKFVNLSSPSISTNVERLLEDKILIENGRSESMGGRKIKFYDVNYNLGYILGIDLSQDEILLGVSNLKPEIIGTKFISIHKKYDKNIENIFKEAKNLLNENSISLDDVVSVVVSSPGVYRENGKLDYVHNEDWFYGTAIFEDLKKAFEKDVLVENDVNLAVIAENRAGTGNSFSFMSYIKIDRGVGAGFILENRLLKGKDGVAGEIGFSILRDRSGNKTTLESLFELSNIYAGIISDIKNGVNTNISNLVSGKLENINIDIVGKAAFMGDEYAKGKIKDLAGVLAQSVSHIICVLGLEVVIIGGKVKSLGKIFLDELRESLKPEIPFDTTITFSNLNDEVGILGGFYLATDKFFDEFYKNI